MEIFNSSSLHYALGLIDASTLHVIFKVIESLPFYFLIDVQVKDEYLSSEQTRLIAARLNIKAPPFLGITTIDYVKKYLVIKPSSYVTNSKLVAVVGRSHNLIMQISVKDVLKFKD
jgi:hypothetical protein